MECKSVESILRNNFRLTLKKTGQIDLTKYILELAVAHNKYLTRSDRIWIQHNNGNEMRIRVESYVDPDLVAQEFVKYYEGTAAVILEDDMVESDLIKKIKELGVDADKLIELATIREIGYETNYDGNELSYTRISGNKLGDEDRDVLWTMKVPEYVVRNLPLVKRDLMEEGDYYPKNISFEFKKYRYIVNIKEDRVFIGRSPLSDPLDIIWRSFPVSYIETMIYNLDHREEKPDVG